MLASGRTCRPKDLHPAAIRGGALLGCLLLLLSISACGGPGSGISGEGLTSKGPRLGSDDEVAITASDTTYIDPTYRLGPADEIEMSFLFDHSLDSRIVVRPDGAINLPIIGDFVVAGMTPGEVCARISKAYGQYYTNPQLSLNLTKFAPAQVYVLGEVRYPKSVIIRPGMTVLSAIAEAGGQTDISKFSGTILIRRVSGNRAVARRLNLTAYVKGKRGVSSDLYLEDFDIIYVPRSFIGRLTTVIDGVLDKMLVVPTLYLKGWEAFHTGRVYTPPRSDINSDTTSNPAQ